MAALADEKVEEVVTDPHNQSNKDVSEEQYVVTDIPEYNDDDLIFEMYYLQCLAQGSYLIGSKSEGNAFIVDPRRDVEFYVSRLNKVNEKFNTKLMLRGILMTHAHADFVAGNVELANRVNKDNGLKNDDKGACHSYFGEKVGTKVDHIAVNDKAQPLYVSKKYQIRPLETPGHTLGCITWVLEKKNDNDDKYTPVKAFTGDTLFIGSVGRPDLVSAPKDSGIKDADEMRNHMASLMYDSLLEKIFHGQNGLPGETHVHPAHGAGSPCGANLSDAMWSTIDNERKTNIALKETKEGKDHFVKWLVGSSKDIEQGTPQYFQACVKANMGGVEDVSVAVSNIHKKMYDAKQFMQAIEDAKKVIDKNGPVYIIDTREADDFHKCHVPGAINFPIGPQKGTVLRKIDGNFAIWLGTLLPEKSQLFIITYDGMQDDAIVRFARINYDSAIQGMLKANCKDWKDSGLETISTDRFSLKNMSQNAAHAKLEEIVKSHTFLDVRTKHEYEESHVKVGDSEAINMPLSADWCDNAKLANYNLSTENIYIAYCSGGYRSTMASSILRYKGYNVIDVHGGYDLGLAPWVDQSKYLTGVHGLCKMSQKWALKLGFEIPSLLATIQQKE